MGSELGVLDAYPLQLCEYLAEPLALETIEQMLSELVDPIEQVVRDVAHHGVEPDFENLSHLAAQICGCPQILQRPILWANGRAKIGRPPASLVAILT